MGNRRGIGFRQRNARKRGMGGKGMGMDGHKEGVRVARIGSSKGGKGEGKGRSRR